MRQAKGLGDRFFMLGRTFKTICQLSITIIAMLKKREAGNGTNGKRSLSQKSGIRDSSEQHFLNV